MKNQGFVQHFQQLGTVTFSGVKLLQYSPQTKFPAHSISESQRPPPTVHGLQQLQHEEYYKEKNILNIFLPVKISSKLTIKHLALLYLPFYQDDNQEHNNCSLAKHRDRLEHRHSLHTCICMKLDNHHQRSSDHAKHISVLSIQINMNYSDMMKRSDSEVVHDILVLIQVDLCDSVNIKPG